MRAMSFLRLRTTLLLNVVFCRPWPALYWRAVSFVTALSRRLVSFETRSRDGDSVAAIWRGMRHAEYIGRSYGRFSSLMSNSSLRLPSIAAARAGPSIDA